MLWRCDIYWCCVRLLGLIVCLTLLHYMHTHTCTTFRQQQALPRSDFKYGLYTPRTPCMRRRPWTWHAMWVSEWVSEWVVHVRMYVCIWDSQQLCSCAGLSSFIINEIGRFTRSLLYGGERGEGGDSVQCCCRGQCDKQRSFLFSLMGRPWLLPLTPKPRPHKTPLGLKGQLGKRFFYKKRHQRPRTAETRCHRYTRKFD
jgi:hypothetical protein